MGILTLSIKNEDVFNNIEIVVEMIKYIIRLIINEHVPPPGDRGQSECVFTKGKKFLLIYIVSSKTGMNLII